MQTPAHLVAQTGAAAYFVALYLILTLPLGIALFVAAAIEHARGPGAGTPVGVPRDLVRRVAVAGALCTVAMLVLAGYHADHWFEHDQRSPGPAFTLALQALVAVQIALVAWLARRSRRRDVVILWGALWLWVQLVVAFVAASGPVLGAL